MKKYRVLVFVLVLVLLTGMVSAAGIKTVPYAIKVNVACNTVTIYGLDANGQHSIPVKAMICSTARPGHKTPLGSYKLAEYRSEWRLMLDGTYGQYATCFSGHYLFHSICYTDDSHDAMKRESYNMLGSPASMGCVRLETIDAKWIFDNCPAGTPVTVYYDPSSPGPLGKPERTVDEISLSMHNGWDPTDPAAGNPWRLIPVEELTLEPTELKMTAGETAALQMTLRPAEAMVNWSSSDETVAKVDSKGNVVALSAGTAEITVEGLNGVSATCLLQVEGELLPFDDLTPGAWYYPELRSAVEAGLFNGLSNRQFAPGGAMTRAMVVQVLYNLAGKPDAPEETFFTDVTENAWYRDAATWAVDKGIVTGLGGQRFAPEQTMTRQELAAVLWRMEKQPKADVDLAAFADHGSISNFAADAMAWMVDEGLLQGSGGKLLPGGKLTRVETAVILQRYADR